MELIYNKFIDLIACALYDIAESDSLEELNSITYKSN